METFLSYIAKDLLSKYGNNLSDIAIVFPNKRASLFLNQELAKNANKPIWSPIYITISELFRQQSELIVADPIKSLCDLFKSYTTITGRIETLDEFYGWGQLLLADFDDIDKNMADAKMVFNNVRDIHELDTIDYLTDEQKELLRRFFINFVDEPTKLKERFISLWSKLYDIYTDFKQRLRSQGLAYEGMLYREVIETNNLPTHHKQFIFIGFNVLQSVEQELFDRLKKEGRAFFYWDYDRYFLNGANEAGVYINKWLEKFPNEVIDKHADLYNAFQLPKEIRYMSAPTENLQARYVTEWLKEGERYKDGKRTAIVMCNENLLQTVIHSVSKDMGEVNVTTGFPLQQTPISSMITQLLKLQTEGYSLKENAFRLHYVNRVLRHPYGKYLIDGADDLLLKLNTEKQYYVNIGENATFIHIEHDRQHLADLVAWLAEATKIIAKNGVASKDPLFQESAFRMFTLLNRLLELLNSGDLEADFNVFKRLLGQLISSTSIPFHGEPAKGIQIMGVLETRNLDFDHVLLLSCNEGNMPKGVDDTSFIPHFIRKAYGLTTIDNKVAIYSYYFHSLLQRAKDVTLLYNNSTQGSKVGEMSRFMLQLMVESPHTIERKALQAGQEPMPTEAKPIEKDEVVRQKLNELSYFSPTAINNFLRCPVKFYYNYIVGLSEANDNDEDEIDNRMFGNIFHLAAELMYKQLFPDTAITKDEIDHVLKTGKSAQSVTSPYHASTLDSVITEAFARELFMQKEGTIKHPKLNGLQLINREAIKRYLKQLLRVDKLVAPLRIIAHEFDVYKQIDINVENQKKTITIGGRVDRLDEINLSHAPQLRVVDYKTGNHVAKELNTIGEIFDSKNIIDKKSDYTLQALLYSILETTNDEEHNPHHNPVSPALLFIQHAYAEDYSPMLSLDGQRITDANYYAQDFFDQLTEIMESLFDKSIPFTHTNNVKMCEYCPYKQLCGR